MVNIVVIQKTGTLRLNNRNPFRQVIKAEHKQSLLSEDVVYVSVDSKTPLNFNLGDKIEYAGRNFMLNSAPKIKRERGFYSYDLQFEGSQYTLRKKIYFNLDKMGFQTSADFPLTGEIDIFLKVLVDNLSKIGEGKWILGEFPKGTEAKTLTFNNENCLAVLQKICQEYDTEFEIKENISAKTYTLNIKKIGKPLDYSFEYGKNNGLYSLIRDNEANDVVTRLYIYGATENIPNNYRDYSNRLRMPTAKGDYIQDDAKVRLFGLKEGVRFFDEVKPSFKGVVTKVGAFDPHYKTQEITVQNMDFDLNESKADGSTKYLIAGTPVKLHFNKGNLAGYEFELLKNGGYNHATKTFKVKQFEDERGQKFPDNDTIFKFAVGDEFTLLDIVMPERYITNAEQRLFEKGRNEYEKISQNNVKYTLDIDPLFLKKRGDENTVFFEIGDYIRLVDAELNIDKRSRIINITRDLLSPYDYKLDIADTYEINFTASVLNDIKDTKKVIKTEKQVNRQNYYKGFKNLAELRENVFDTEGYFDTEKIKPNSIETNMLSVGAKNQQFVLEEVTLEPNVNGNANSVRISEGRLVHFSISDQIKEWRLLPINQQNLLDVVYYVYAKVERNGNMGSWLTTTEKIKFDERANYYHFLCYLLYTPKNGKREAEAMYGNVMMHGGQITAGRIKSTNGKAYFDLDTGEISGRINFTNVNEVKDLISDNERIKRLEEKTSFIGSTIIDGDVVATGTIITGNNQGANAGITGEGGSKDVFLWGGTGFANRREAPISLTRDGKLVIRHGNGKIGFEIGIANGYLTLNGYHEEGFKLFEIDPNRGFVNIEYTKESWKPVQVVFLGNSKDVSPFITTRITRHNYTSHGVEIKEGEASIVPNRTIYDYQTGAHPENLKYKKYVGYKTEAKKREEYYNVPEGWYVLEHGVLGSFIESPHFRPLNTTVFIYYIKNGIIEKREAVKITVPKNA